MESHQENGMSFSMPRSIYSQVYLPLHRILYVHIPTNFFSLYRYYEFEVITAEFMKVGWAKVTLDSGTELGLDGDSYAFDGFGVCKFYMKFLTLNVIMHVSILNLMNISTPGKKMEPWSRTVW